MNTVNKKNTSQLLKYDDRNMDTEHFFHGERLLVMICPECQGRIIPQGRCFVCQSCGFSNCWI